VTAPRKPRRLKPGDDPSTWEWVRYPDGHRLEPISPGQRYIEEAFPGGEMKIYLPSDETETTTE